MSMIPKTIHYCWFGRTPLPESARKCIDSWRQVMPDFEIKEWNEDNFDVHFTPYTSQAYAARNYAYVSDVARFWILQREGGVCFDTDVEALRPVDDLLAEAHDGGLMGWETRSISGKWRINPGLIVAMPIAFPLCEEILDAFGRMSFYKDDGTVNDYTMMPLIADLLRARGLVMDGSRQTVGRLTVLPADYFCPLDRLTGRLHVTQNTRTIHHCTMSWMPWTTRVRLNFMRMVRYLLHV